MSRSDEWQRTLDGLRTEYKRRSSLVKILNDIDSNCDCEVRWDHGQGGPILTLTDDEGCMEQFFIARPDRFA